MKLIDLYNKKVEEISNKQETQRKKLGSLINSLHEFADHFERQTGKKLDPYIKGSYVRVSCGMYLFKFNYEVFLTYHLSSPGKPSFKKDLEEQDSPLEEFVYRLARIKND